MAFLYTGQPSNHIPRNVTRVIIDGSVKDIGRRAFDHCKQLRKVELRDGLERIEEDAFYRCNSLVGISIPSTTKEIGRYAFAYCKKLRNVELRDGLERIDDDAFWACYSLVGISIPSTTKEIGQYAFAYCKQLRNVELRDGLERIEANAFDKCSSLVGISIPSTVNHISVNAFEDCDGIVKIEFCEEVEKLVSVASLRDWWNHGIPQLSLLTYSFLAQHSIPRRLGLIKRRMGMWVDNIHAMLQCIHVIHLSNENTNIGGGDHDDDNLHFSVIYDNADDSDDWHLVKEYFESIKSRLAYYEHLQEEVAPLLELALWKSKMSEHLSSSRDIKQMKQQCRFDSEMMGSIIIPNALSFL